jgi:hypothetical protein
MTPANRTLTLLSRRGTTVATDSDAAAWAAAVTSAGGTYTAGDLSALSAFITSAKANSYWTKLTCFGPLMGDQLTAALVQYKSGAWAAATNTNFVSGDYTRATGLTGNSTSKSLNTGLNPNTSLTLNSTHLSVYSRSSTPPAVSAGGNCTIGSSDGGGNLFELIAPHNNGTAYSDQNNSANGRTSAVLTAPYGFVIGTRTANNSHVLYRNGVSIASSATSTSLGSLPAVTIAVCAINGNGTPANWVSNPIGMYSIGAGLTGTDATNYNTNIQTLMTALGRNV